MSLALKPSHTAVKAYYETLHQFGQLYIDHEGAVRRYAANLRRELPRIPFVGAEGNTRSFDSVKGFASESLHSAQDDKMEKTARGAGATDDAKCIDPSARKERGSQDDNMVRAVAVGAGVGANDVGIFREFVKAGRRLAEIHVNYELQSEYPLIKTEKAGEKLDYRVVKMKLSKDKTSLICNQFLTLSGIPPETYEYRLGNRSALEWVIDQYQVSTDKRSGISNDPNRADDPQYILRLIGQVVTVSLETVGIVRSLPALGWPA